MEKKKQLFSYLGSVFVFCMLAFSVFLPGAKAEAALTIKEINYENSTITISTDASDQVLYFSDKNKRKWEMATDTFAGNVCTMDISWISMTRDYVITFKGDQSNSNEEILSVTLPKQISNFKAKYDQSTGKVVFTGAGTNRTIEYRKNNTNSWTELGKADASQENLKESLSRLCENGASVYFRLKAENGSAANAGQRPSKEVACKINKKTAAPNVTINTADSTIAVQSGWQVRKVTIEEKSGVQYVTGTESVAKYTDNSDEDSGWYTYSSAQDVPLEDLAPEAVFKDAEGKSGSKSDVCLQFRKAATKSSQISYMTTVKVPAQEAAPTEETAGVSMEYTSTASFKLTISSASSSRPYEYCIIDSDDLGGSQTIPKDLMEDVVWNTVSTSAATQIKKADAPNGGIIFFRKKAIGKTGDDNFKLASPSTKYRTIEYSSDLMGTFNKDFYIFDGVCTTNNSAGYQQFTFKTGFNSKIKGITLSQTPDPSQAGDSTATVNSSVAVNSAQDSNQNGADKYIVTTTITNINLNADLKTILESKKELVLYAYIEFESGDTISSNDTKGLRIHMRPKSFINHTLISSDHKNQYTVTRLVGSTTKNTERYEDFWFELDMGVDDGTKLGSYADNAEETMKISSVQLGSYSLEAGKDYSYDKETKKFTVYLSKFETNEELKFYYGTTQTLTIQLSNGEKLTDATVKLIAPVALDDTYAWAFTNGQLVENKIVTTATGSSIAGDRVNSYSVGYVKDSSVRSVELAKVTLDNKNILEETTQENRIIFSNKLLNTVGPVSGNNRYVKFTFIISYPDGAEQTYTIDRGCSFTIM